MKDQLKEELSVNEQAEIISIIWRVARKYKLKLQNEQKRSISIVEELDLAIEDSYSFSNFDSLEYKKILNPLIEDQKTAIVNQLNMLIVTDFLLSEGSQVQFPLGAPNNKTLHC